MILNTSFLGVEMFIESVAKIVPRASLPNNGSGYDMLLGQQVLPHSTFIINITMSRYNCYASSPFCILTPSL